MTPLPRTGRHWADPRRWRPRVVRQHERADCGPACLLTVLRFWGGDSSLSDVREMAGTDRSGTTLLGLQRAARALGMTATGVRTDLDTLSRELPAVVHLVLEDGRSHFAVVFGADSRRVRVGDPAEGRRVLDRGAFETLWRTRAALLVRPGPDLARAVPPSWWRWIAPYLRNHAPWLGQTVFLGAIGTALGLASALGIQLLIDRFIPGRDVSMILWTGALLGLLVLCRAALGYLRRALLLRIHRNLAVSMNRRLLAHLYRLPVRFFETRTTGDLTARLDDAARVQQALVSMVGTVAMDGLVVVGSVAYLALVSPPIAAVACLCVPVYGLLLARATAPLADRQREALEDRTRVESSWIDTLTGIVEILAHGVAGTFRGLGGSRFRKFQARVERLGRAHADVAVLAELAGGALALGTLIWGALLVVQDALLLGELVAAYSLLAGILPSAERLAGAWGSAREASVAAHRLADILTARPEAPRGGGRPVPVVRELRLRGATLERAPGRVLIREAEATLTPGTLSALEGPVGSGKTTLLRALARLVPLAEGEILLNGVPADRFDLSDYRRRVALCTGAPRIFEGTLAENVRLGRGEPPRSGAGARLLAAAAAHLLPRFPQGWDTELGDGGRSLSDGERQVVGYLRALWNSPEVLLADEVVSAADEEVAGILLAGLGTYARDHVVLLVTHDPRALGRAGRVYRLSEGRLLV